MAGLVGRANLCGSAVGCHGYFQAGQILVITGVLAFLEQGPASIGWAPSTWFSGLRKGAVWSIAFGLAAAAAMLVIYLLGMNPFQIIRAPLPVEPASLVLFFFVGGLIAPVAEELCFRGIVYSFFRRWGILSALAASTSLFVVLHSSAAFRYPNCRGDCLCPGL